MAFDEFIAGSSIPFKVQPLTCTVHVFYLTLILTLLTEPIFNWNADILSIIDFFINFDFLKYYVKILCILKTELFGIPLNFALRWVSTHLSQVPALLVLQNREQELHLELIFSQFEEIIFHFLLFERMAHPWGSSIIFYPTYYDGNRTKHGGKS